ncbi:malate dehydrogenase [Candidatus Kaiserbacteria bacterium RIFCSPHIGHO2_02_FULL_50_9]|uniref:Malate dehydrogenase n=1 Tax=Candidatus Kaiserbacteria bacterium RIFCSPLOWO2_01_FULL_51_21 TaxID=1798508 RepID=A0A1F6ECW0_9BACT|nr:MAG: malate dehydrogenase [Candidatus Kaiserbacteria bacterium RIFCSPHIGHO2_01_FULL_51_33]OGG63287.1 MAG: malate dehydrogenase [Candidatus Kaiserbacteria bacterium RIFCSPHIGHO2_02_FULL_50_9]OGG71440.1 MAG: malate dehydrogenase [Candidatus Kaiserbacteria bacterium RIFCSPLOWO2_01_FULL_51_21]
MASNIGKRSLQIHKKLGGKIAVQSKASLRTRADLSLFYTPGVGAVSSYLAKHKKEIRDYTIKRNTVAIVSDGSAVLGLGNIGPEGALPVMEGKAMIFKEFAGIDAFPIVLATQDVNEIVTTVTNIAPVFGGINLEDISAPRCFEIERRLIETLDIPVMHDDQHGTAIVVLAALMNAFKVVKKPLGKATIVIAGAGAAGTAVAKLLHRYGVGELIVLDSKGILGTHRHGLTPMKKELVKISNRRHLQGDIGVALQGADAIVGVSGPNTIKEAHVQSMAKRPIVFALANPIPEIMPNLAHHAGAAVVASGRSDFPNQVNNALVFPGVFRGALDHGVRQITERMKLNAAKALAAVVKKPRPDYIIPSVFDKRVVKVVASAIRG